MHRLIYIQTRSYLDGCTSRCRGDGEVVETLDAGGLRKLLVRSAVEFGGAAQRFQLSDNDPRMMKLLPFIHGFRIRVTRMTGIAQACPGQRAHARRYRAQVLSGTGQ